MSDEPKPNKKERKVALRHLWGWPPPYAKEWVETGVIPEGVDFDPELGALADLLAWYREYLANNKTEAPDE